MRCFEVTDRVISGLPIANTDGNRPCVLIAGRGGVVTDTADCALLTDSFVEQIEAANKNGLGVTRLQRCDYELRNDLWLAPESEDTTSALVLFSAHHLVQQNPGRRRVRTVGECEVIRESEFRRNFLHYPADQDKVTVRKCTGVLFKLSPGAELVVEEVVKEERKSFIKGTSLEEVTNVLACIGMRENGSVWVKFGSERAEYLCQVAAGAPPTRLESGE